MLVMLIMLQEQSDCDCDDYVWLLTRRAIPHDALHIVTSHTSCHLARIG